MSIKAIDLRRGQAIDYKDSVWVCVDNTKVEKGKGKSFYQIELKNILTGRKIRERFNTTDPLEPVNVDRRSMEYLYCDGSNFVVMDPETYEQTEIPLELLGEKTVYLIPNIMIEIGSVEGKPSTAELPNFVMLKVVDTPPQVKGATATNQLKEAECESGAKIRVPPFIENGETIKVDTRTGEYLGRA